MEKILSPFIVFPEGNQNIKQAILQDRKKILGLNQTVIKRKVIMPVLKSLI